MDPVVLAFLMGGLSAFSLPLGAAVGLWLSPGLRVTAAVMAFGAGSLLFALVLELVIPGLEHFPEERLTSFFWLAAGCLIGCLIFIGFDRVLANMGGYLRKASTITSRLKLAKKAHYRAMLDKLSLVDLMVSLPPEEIRRVISHIERRDFKAGEVICHEEDPCDALFLIESGRVRVTRHSGPEAGAAPSSLLEKGAAFGEMSLVTGLSPIARAVAETDTQVWEIHKDDFSEIVAVSPGLQVKLSALAQSRTQETRPGGMDADETSRWLAAASANLETELGKPTEAEVIEAANAQRRKGGNVALAIWLGIALDGVPESLIIGSTLQGSAVSIALIGGLFLANFPESMSSAVVMKRQGGKTSTIIGMWTSLMIMTAVGAAIGNLFIAEAPPHMQALLEGMAAGAMLAMIAQTMLPEAFDHGGWLTGLMTVIGFLTAVFMGTLDENRIEPAHALHSRPQRPLAALVLEVGREQRGGGIPQPYERAA